MLKVTTTSTLSWFFLPDLISSPVAALWWGAAGGFLVELVLTVAVCWGVCDAGAAGRCGRTGGGLGFNLQPLVTQSLRKVVVNGDADGELGAGLLVVQAQAPLEVLLHHVLVVAFGNHWKASSKWLPARVSQGKWVGVSVWGGSPTLTWWVSSVDLGSAGRVPQRWDTGDHGRPHLQIQTVVWIRSFHLNITSEPTSICSNLPHWEKLWQHFTRKIESLDDFVDLLWFDFGLILAF